MKVLYYLDNFPKLSTSFIINEIYELEQRGHDVAVCSLNKSNTDIVHEEFEELDAPIRYLEKPTYSDIPELLSGEVFNSRVLRSARYRASLNNHAKNLLRAKRCIEFVDELEDDIDHIHTHFATISGFGARYVASYHDVSFTITTHAYDLYEEPVREYTSSLLSHADRVITISEYNKQYLQERFIEETPIDIVRAGIRPEKFSPTESTVENRILTVSRFIEKKGLRYALEAIAKVADRIPSLEYHIVGSGPLEDDLKNRVTRYGIDENVTFLENVNDQRLIDEFDEARGFLLPSVISESGDRDGIPVVLMEAMAMKTPPVSTMVSGIPELVDHEKNGLLVSPRDVDATADAVTRLLQEDSEWERYREQAREKVVQEFNIATEAEKLENTFKTAQTYH